MKDVYFLDEQGLIHRQTIYMGEDGFYYNSLGLKLIPSDSFVELKGWEHAHAKIYYIDLGDGCISTKEFYYIPLS